VLAEALQAEVDVYIARHADQRDADGRWRWSRHGSTTAASTPRRANGGGSAQRSSPPWRPKTPKITEVLPLLYLHGTFLGPRLAEPQQGEDPHARIPV